MDNSYFYETIKKMDINHPKEYNDHLLVLYLWVDTFLAFDLSKGKEMLDQYQTLIHEECVDIVHHLYYEICYIRYLYYIKDEQVKEQVLKTYQNILQYIEIIHKKESVDLILDLVFVLSQIGDYHQAICMCENLLSYVDEDMYIFEFLRIVSQLALLHYMNNQLVIGIQYYLLFMDKYNHLDDLDMKERLRIIYNEITNARNDHFL